MTLCFTTVTVLLRDLEHELSQVKLTFRAGIDNPTYDSMVREALIYRWSRSHVPMISGRLSDFIRGRTDDLCNVIRGFESFTMIGDVGSKHRSAQLKFRD